MTRVLATQLRPFSGWGVFEEKCRALGPQRLLACFVRDMCLEMNRGRWRYFGDGLHNHQNHGFLSRVLLRLWIDAGENQIPLCEKWRDDDNKRVDEILEEANDRYAQFTRKRISLDGPGNKMSEQFIRKLAELSWLQALTSNARSEDINAELGRIWWLIREAWPRFHRSHRRNQDQQLPLPMNTAFESMEHILLLMMAVLLNKGYLKNPRDALAKTDLADKVDTLVSLYIPDAVDIVEDWDTLRRFPNEHFDSPFRKHPILKLPNGGLICPDPSLLFTAFQDRLFDRILEEYGEEASSIMGVLFEEYVGEILKIIAESSGETFFPEFDLRTRKDKQSDSEKSPDGFLLGQMPMIFEVKFTRFPKPTEKNWKHTALTTWLGKLTGQTEKRLPFQQGLNFFDAWRQGNNECVSRLGDFPGFQNLYYIIVSTEDPPLAAHWDDFRGKVWSRDFNSEQKVLLDRTLILSVQDLEALAHLLHGAAAKGDFLKTDSLFSEWRKEWRNKGLRYFTDSRGNWEINYSLARFLEKRYSDLLTGARPEFFERNLRRFWDATERVGFEHQILNDG